MLRIGGLNACGLAAGLVALVLGGELLAQEYPVEHFFQNPRFTAMQLSPDGTHVAALTPVNGHRNVVVVNLADRQAQAATRLDDIDVRGFFWATNERLVFTVDSDGNESFGLYAVDKDGSRGRALIEPARGVALVQRSSSVIDRLENDPDHILITYNDRNLFYPDVYELDIQNGAKRRVTIPPGNPQFWLADHDGVVRFVAVEGGRPRDLISRYMYRADEGSDWVQLFEGYHFDPGWYPLDFTADNQKLYVTSNLEGDAKAVYVYDPATKQMEEKLFSVEGYDVTEIVLSRTRHEIVSIDYADSLPRRHLMENEWKRIYEAIDAALPETHNIITSMTDDEQRMIIAAVSDKDPGSYYFYDRGTNELEFFAERMPWLDPDTMAAMEPITYTARDGELINGYLTLPVDRAQGEPVPLIVHPHGGPYGIRDHWQFNRDIQFLANRGYAVLQMNFRGSGGYGKRFVDIGYKRWGLQMQHDVTDGVNWAIERGIADPGRICIYGASYGGYVAMAGVTQTPDLYQCAISYVGVVDLEMLERWTRPFEAFEAWFDHAIGNPSVEGERLVATSPINHVDEIRVPILVVHGEQDNRVEIDQARRLLRAFRQQDVEHEVLIKRDEGHGFRKEENNLELYTLMGEFLKEHL